MPLRVCLLGRPLKGRNILGCFEAISLHLHFRVLPGINRFQIIETGFETGFQSKVLEKSRTLRLKQVSDSWKLFFWNWFIQHTVKYSEMLPPRYDDGTSWDVPTLERATHPCLICMCTGPKAIMKRKKSFLNSWFIFTCCFVTNLCKWILQIH